MRPAPGRAAERCAPAASEKAAIGQGRAERGNRQRAGPAVRGDGAEPEVGRRLHLSLHGRGLALCSSRHGPVLASRGRLVDERHDGSTAGHRCADDGDLAPRQAGRAAALFRSRQPTRLQAVVATRICADLSASSNASAGVLQPRVVQGLALSTALTATRSCARCMLRSVPFGKYYRSNPLVFSFVPRCHGLCGSQK